MVVLRRTDPKQVLRILCVSIVFTHVLGHGHFTIFCDIFGALEVKIL